MQGLGGHTGRSPGLHLPGSRPQEQVPGCKGHLLLGEGKGHSRLLRKSQGKPRWRQRLGATPPWARRARPGAATSGDPSPAPGMQAFSRLPPGLCTGPARWLCWFSSYAYRIVVAFLEPEPRDRPEPPPSCLPDDSWGGRSSNGNSSSNSHPLLPRYLTNITSLHLHRNPML